VSILERLGTGFSKLVGGTPTHRALVTEEEIRTMISVGKQERVVEEAEAKMLRNVFQFGDDPVREAMIPRPDVIWVEKGTTLGDFLSIYSQNPHTRFPVYAEVHDNVVGVLSIKDVLMAQAEGQLDKETPIDRLVRSIPFVPEMQASGSQMAAVVDEYGGIAGIATIKQLLAQIVGRFGDSSADRSQEFQTIDEHTYDVDGSMRIEEVNESLGLNLPDGDYETIAGLVLSRLGHIPKESDQLRCGDLKLVVKEMRGLKIEKLRIIKEVR
jgi:putative hemolysin